MSLPQPVSLPMLDADWVARIRRGDDVALRRLFDAYYDPLCRYAMTLTGNRDTSEDVVQTVFVWIWDHRDTWEVRGNLRSYLYRAVHSRVISDWRAARRRAAHMEEARRSTAGRAATASQNQPDAATQYAELEDAYERAVAALPPRGRQAFELHRHHGLSSREVAEVMGISPRTVEVHIGRALLAVREALVGYLAVLLVLSAR